MVEKLVEPSAKNFGDEVVEAFVQAGIIRNDGNEIIFEKLIEFDK